MTYLEEPCYCVRREYETLCASDDAIIDYDCGCTWCGHCRVWWECDTPLSCVGVKLYGECETYTSYDESQGSFFEQLD